MTGPTVIKIGGSTLGEHDTSLADCAALARDGTRLVLVHGGGAAVSDWLGRLDVPVEFVGGLRKTTAEAREVVVAVLAGLVNTSLVQQFAALDVPAVGLAGADAGILRSPVSTCGLGFVGDDPVCDPGPIVAVLDAGYLPVIAPIGLTPDGEELLNINADTAAGAIAAALHAEQLVMLTDVAGVLDADGEVIGELDDREGERLQEAGTIDGGMLPKLAACRAAATTGAEARIVDGRVAGAVAAAVRGEGGTRIL